VNVVIGEKTDGTWSLWVTEKAGGSEPSIFTAAGRSADEILAVLPVILAMRPAGRSTGHAPALKGSDLAHAKRAALQAALDALDGWIESAQENHGASGHRYEDRGRECWRSFAPADIRNMINDAAREVGLKPFPAPKAPEEDELT
jgi:hypothetical protein